MYNDERRRVGTRKPVYNAERCGKVFPNSVWEREKEIDDLKQQINDLRYVINLLKKQEKTGK
jgi:hypothetical protein